MEREGERDGLREKEWGKGRARAGQRELTVPRAGFRAGGDCGSVLCCVVF